MSDRSSSSVEDAYFYHGCSGCRTGFPDLLASGKAVVKEASAPEKPYRGCGVVENRWEIVSDQSGERLGALIEEETDPFRLLFFFHRHGACTGDRSVVSPLIHLGNVA